MVRMIIPALSARRSIWLTPVLLLALSAPTIASLSPPMTNWRSTTCSGHLPWSLR